MITSPSAAVAAVSPQLTARPCTARSAVSYTHLTAPTGLLQQPRPFFMIFFVELWERFGYYGVQGILAVFFVKQLGFSQEQAFITFGAFAALRCV